MTTFTELCGFSHTKIQIMYGGGGGGGGGKSNSKSSSNSNSKNNSNHNNGNIFGGSNNAAPAAPAATSYAPPVSPRPQARPADLNTTLNSDRQGSGNSAPVVAPVVNTARMAVANAITPGDGMTYADGQLINEDDNSLVTDNTPYQELANALTPTNGTTYDGGQLNSGNDNTARMAVANAITPNDGMAYADGQLINDDGSLVTDNTGYQDLTNYLTVTDGKMYEDGQLTDGTIPTDTSVNTETSGNTFVNTATSNTGPDVPPDVAAPLVQPDFPQDVADPVVQPDVIEEDTTPTIEDVITQIQGSTMPNDIPDGEEFGATDLPDLSKYITEEQLAEYIKNLDLGSNEYDPAAFMNMFGFAMESMQSKNLINTSPESSGAYVRRAVKDRETGEIRYVNVPIGKGAIAGNDGVSQFRLNRRNGFASMV
jgi:hypothetical protein